MSVFALPRVSNLIVLRLHIISTLLLLLVQPSLQEEGNKTDTNLTAKRLDWIEDGNGTDRNLTSRSLDWLGEECGAGPLRPTLVRPFTVMSICMPAYSVLVLGEEDGKLEGSSSSSCVENYWLAEPGKTSGQGITFRLDNCKRRIAGVQIKNIGKGYGGSRATDQFKVLGSAGNVSGPWETLVEHHLPDSRGKPALLLNYTFKEPVEIQFIRFELVSYWGVHGGGLQYFVAIPATIDCNVTTWSKWGGCCDGERKRTKTVHHDGECKVVSELEGCAEDNCTGDSSIPSTGPGSEVTSEELTIGLAVLSGVLLLVLLVVLYLFFKMWSTHKNAIKKDFNPLYGVDYEGDEESASQAGKAAKNKEDPRQNSVDQQYDYMGE